MNSHTSCALAALVLVTGCSRTGLDLDDLEEDVDAGAVVPCTPGTFTLSKAVPAVMFVLDRSGSMDDELSQGETRWEVLTNALASSLPPVDGSMEIGALLFPSAPSADGESSDALACSLPSNADLTLATGHVSALLALMEQTQPAGGTPTSGAMGVAAGLLLDVRAATTARAIVLATDGAPNCNASLDPQTCICADTNQGCFRDALECLDDARTVQSIASYAAQGLPTYVIGIQNEGDTEDTQVLDEMAVAGGRPQTGADTSYYAVSSEADLDSALVAIRDQVGACTFLTTSVPGAEGSITVSLGGTTIPYDPTGKSGWSWGDKDNGQILFAGATCTSVTGANAVLTAQVACIVPDASTP
jgi:hypothetical protein